MSNETPIMIPASLPASIRARLRMGGIKLPSEKLDADDAKWAQPLPLPAVAGAASVAIQIQCTGSVQTSNSEDAAIYGQTRRATAEELTWAKDVVFRYGKFMGFHPSYIEAAKR